MSTTFPIPSPASPVDDALPVVPAPALDTTDPAAVVAHLDSLLPGGESGAWVWPDGGYLEATVEADGRVAGEFQYLPAAAVAAFLTALRPPT